MSGYAWMITKDHLTDSGDDTYAVGIIGPSDATDAQIYALRDNEGQTFRIYDDDGILYFTGRGISEDGSWDEDACVGPLRDFGAPDSGAVLIKWHGHPERTCEW